MANKNVEYIIEHIEGDLRANQPGEGREGKDLSREVGRVLRLYLINPEFERLPVTYAIDVFEKLEDDLADKGVFVDLHESKKIGFKVYEMAGARDHRGLQELRDYALKLSPMLIQED